MAAVIFSSVYNVNPVGNSYDYGLSKQEQENAIPTFTRKIMKDQRTLIRFSLRIPFEDETIICEGLQSVGVQFLRSREPAGYMESQLSRFLNVMEGRA